MLGTQFTVFDNGQSPKGRSVNENSLRHELVAIAYVSHHTHTLTTACVLHHSQPTAHLLHFSEIWPNDSLSQ